MAEQEFVRREWNEVDGYTEIQVLPYPPDPQSEAPAHEEERDEPSTLEVDRMRKALDLLRDVHNTPLVDEEHQGGSCVDVVLSQLAEQERLRRVAKWHALHVRELQSVITHAGKVIDAVQRGTERPGYESADEQPLPDAVAQVRKSLDVLGDIRARLERDLRG